MTVKTQELLKDKLRAKNVLRYMLLPNIIPQIKELAGSGFGYFAFLIATVYNAVRILPANHPYLNPSNIGKFGLREVIAAAANNITVNKNNWDQILIFVAILAGILLLALQFLALIFMVFNGQALAAGPPAVGLMPFTGMFNTPHKETDIAFLMLDHTFGIPSFFGSDAPTGTSFHLALHELFHFYNLAILIVAVIVFIYYIIVVVAETAQTGTPFGKRFAHIYAPIRLVVAIGLLIPVAHGFNSAQYITLYAAKIGSGFATNGWILFNKGLTNPTGAPDASLIGYPEAPDPTSLVSAMGVIVSCRETYKLEEKIEIKAYFYDGINDVELPAAASAGGYELARTGSPNGEIEIKFGADVTSLPSVTDIRSYCGSVIIPAYIDPAGVNKKAAGDANLQEDYFNIINYLWRSPRIEFIGKRVATAKNDVRSGMVCALVPDPDATPDPCTAGSYMPVASHKEEALAELRSIIENNLKLFIDDKRSSVKFDLNDDILKRGWGGAGIWYSKIAEINGAYTVAALNLPHIKHWPETLEYIRDERTRAQDTTSSCEMFEANLPGDRAINLTGHNETYASVMDETYQYWRCHNTRLTTNVFWDTIAAIFGTNGLFDVRQASMTTDSSGNPIVSVHPLTQLTLIGKGLVESAIRNMGFAMVGGLGAGMQNILGPAGAQSAQAASGFFVSIATIGLSMGFMLFYILPFLPFIYFFFAVGAWVKSIFEAMCAAPLWAISHLRIDGEGLPGKSAMNGYFLIFEIFLRPILTVFGLVAGMATFVALASMLNELFDLVVENVTGNASSAPGADTETFGRHIVDQFFFTIVYAVILYMMGISSFKMINLVPNNILRWLGSSASAFSDNTQDPTQGLSQYAAIGGMRIGGQLAGGATELARGVGSIPDTAVGAGRTGG
jgi:conjugal transfer/type IV secretion protein DotA/TraY